VRSRIDRARAALRDRLHDYVEAIVFFPDHLEVKVSGAPRLNVLLSEVGLRDDLQPVDGEASWRLQPWDELLTSIRRSKAPRGVHIFDRPLTCGVVARDGRWSDCARAPVPLVSPRMRPALPAGEGRSR